MVLLTPLMCILEITEISKLSDTIIVLIMGIKAQVANMKFAILISM